MIWYTCLIRLSRSCSNACAPHFHLKKQPHIPWVGVIVPEFSSCASDSLSWPIAFPRWTSIPWPTPSISVSLAPPLPVLTSIILSYRFPTLQHHILPIFPIPHCFLHPTWNPPHPIVPYFRWKGQVWLTWMVPMAAASLSLSLPLISRFFSRR